MPLLALFCWLMSRVVPLLAEETREHSSSLALDGLRGVLAPSVFFHHAYTTYVFMKTGVWGMPSSNFYGQLGPSAVTVFFFISGYLFWGKVLRNPSSIRPRKLWPNRLRRILPAYWAAVMLAFAIVALASGFQRREPLSQLISGAVQWLLFGFPLQPSLNGVYLERITSGVFWSLRMEVLFYLLLPGLVWFRRGRRIILLFTVAVALYLFALRLSSQSEIISANLEDLRQLLLNLCTTFAVGMLAAYRPWSSKVVDLLRSRWAAALSLLLVVLQLVWVKPQYTWQEPILLVVPFLAVVEGNSFFGVLTTKPARCLGQISYSFYIFHGMLLFLLTAIWNVGHPIASMTMLSYWILILCIGMVVVGFSTASYWCIERPFLAKRSLNATSPVAT
jgi:peptidoglycan/LPS O-acetylase OafA/YrhL